MPGSVTLVAVADAYVDESAPSTNFGATTALFVTSRDRSRNKRTLVRFATPTVPAGCTVQGATLGVVSRERTGRTVHVVRAGGSWSESGVTWQTQPSTAGTASTALVDASGRIEWDVTGHVRTGAANGFVLRDASENSKSPAQSPFFSRESSNAPTLVVRWS